MIRLLAAATLLLFSGQWIFAQDAPTPPSFENATIRLSNPHVAGHRFHRAGPKHFAVDNHTLKDCIAFAYNVPPGLISGGPAWIGSARYDIVIEASALNATEVLPVFRAFLADRFKLLIHSEQKQLEVLNLVVGEGELKITKSTVTDQTPSLLISGQRQSMILVGRNATMAEFAAILQRNLLDIPVVDQTGLSGRFDFDLKWGRPTPAVVTGVEQLGLALEPVQSFSDTLVVDYIEKPDVN